MHGSVREGLENLLADEPSAAAIKAAGHLSGCAECASETDLMRAHSQMFKALQAPADLEPSAGFYARVMQRIEASAKRSIWWVFVYRPVGNRLAFASLAVALALGSYVVVAETSDGHLGTRPALVQDSNSYAMISGSADEQRAAVLANFVSHPAPSR